MEKQKNTLPAIDVARRGQSYGRYRLRAKTKKPIRRTRSCPLRLKDLHWKLCRTKNSISIRKEFRHVEPDGQPDAAITHKEALSLAFSATAPATIRMTIPEAVSETISMAISSCSSHILLAASLAQTMSDICLSSCRGARCRPLTCRYIRGPDHLTTRKV